MPDDDGDCATLVPLFPCFALLQGVTSTVWVVAAKELTPRHGSPVFTAAISHCLACVFLTLAASKELWAMGLAGVRARSSLVPYRGAFIAGLGWSFSLYLIYASPVLGIALTQVLVVSGELIVASLVDWCLDAAPRLALLTALPLVVLGVFCSLLDESHHEVQGEPKSLGEVFVWALGAFGLGACMVFHSLGNTHLKRYIGARPAGAWSAFVASFGNVLFWAASAWQGVCFKPDASPTTMVLWLCVGGASTWAVAVNTFVPGRIGFALTFTLGIIGKLSCGLLVDALGFTVRRRPVTWTRGLGVALVLVAVVVFKVSKELLHAREYAQLDEPDHPRTYGKTDPCSPAAASPAAASPATAAASPTAAPPAARAGAAAPE